MTISLLPVDDPWYPGEALDTYTFEEKDGRTITKITMRFETKEGRDGGWPRQWIEASKKVTSSSTACWRRWPEPGVGRPNCGTMAL